MGSMQKMQAAVFIALMLAMTVLIGMSAKPRAPTLTPEQKAAVYKQDGKPINFREMSKLIGVERGEGQAPLEMAKSLEEAGFADAAKAWRGFHADKDRAGTIKVILAYGVSLVMFVMGVFKFIGLRRAAQGSGQTFAAKAAPTAFLLFASGYFAMQPVYYSEFASLIEASFGVLAFVYVAMAASQRFRMRNIAGSDDSHAERLEIAACMIVTLVWPVHPLLWAYNALMMAAIVLKIACVLYPWVAGGKTEMKAK